MNTIQSYFAIFFKAWSKGLVSRKGTILMLGYSSTSAPRSSNFFTSLLACERALVTRILLPNRGFVSNHAIVSRKPVTSPMTRAIGGPKLAWSPILAILLMGPVTTRCLAVVPHWISAAGRSPGTPRAESASTISFKLFHAITNTSVPGMAANASQLIVESGLRGSSLPVTIVSEVAIPRWVTGIPA